MKQGDSWTLVLLWVCLVMALSWVAGFLFGVAYKAAAWVIGL